MKIVAISNARLSSKRLHHKMIKKFSNTCLVEIALKRLTKVKNFDKVYFAACEKKLLEYAKKYLSDESIIVRSKESAAIDGPITKIHHYLRDIDTEYFMWINCCHSMLKPKTIDNAVKFFLDNKLKSMTSVIKKNTFYYDHKSKPMNSKNPLSQTNTKTLQNVYECVNAFHIFNKNHFFKTKSYWKNKKNDPYLYEINPIEALDVDTADDFIISSAVYNYYN